MTIKEQDKWMLGTQGVSFYAEMLQKALTDDYAKLRKTVKAEELPWEDSPQGLIKHLCNDKMDVRMKSIDSYMQVIEPGGRSGKHRHMSEEILFILEGEGYDLHWDVEADINDIYVWKIPEEPKKFQWERGDLVYIPVNTIHQHFNASRDKQVRFISATSRVVRQLGFEDLEQLEEATAYRKGLLNSLK